MTRVHAVTVHHKGFELLDRCLRSLGASEDVALESVVVANACGESLPTVVDEVETVHLVRSETPLGFSAANNLGVRWSVEHLGEPDYYFFFNNDTTVEPATLSTLVTLAEANGRYGILGPRLMILGAEGHLNSLGLNVTRDGEAWDEGIGRPASEYESLEGVERQVLAVTGSGFLVRSETLRQLGGWAELYHFYYEDIDLCLRARSAGWEVVNVPRAVMWHAISATAERGSDLKLVLTWRNRLLLLLVHWPWGLLLRITPRLVVRELWLIVRRFRARAFRDARLQARAWLGCLMSLPRALALRFRSGGDRGWTHFLFPEGSVPVIELPPLRPTPESGIQPEANIS